MIVFVAVGNSDDKLKQRDWVSLQLDLRDALDGAGVKIHGEWHSYPDSIFQNACLCFEVDEDKVPELQGHLRALAIQYKQDSIAWTQAADRTEFLGQPVGLRAVA